MIAKAPDNGKRGGDTYGLLRYLFGPGRANEHRDPHLVAAWDPDWLPGGLFAEQQRGWLARLGREVDAAMTGHAVEVPGGHVYHVVLSIPEQDGALGDAVWRDLMEEAVERMGFGPDAEGHAGCRWVAVHHGPSVAGNDHVHLVLNLVRGDGRIANTYRDWPRWRAWCLDVERQHGLTPTSPANKTAPIRATRAETEKAHRQGRAQTSREYLRQVVRAAAAQASAADEFVALVGQRVLIDPRWGTEGQFTGYKVAVRVDQSRSAPDGLVWFGGGTLARDLSAPKLVARWASAPAPPPLPSDERDGTAIVGRAERAAAIQDATESAARARDRLATLAAARSNADSDVHWPGSTAAEDTEGIAHATLDLMVAAAQALDDPTPRPIAAAAAAYELAAATPYRVQPTQWGPVAAELRTAARRLARVGVLSRRGNAGIATAALIVALTALLAEIAAWRQQTGQLQQAAAAHRAVALISADEAIRDPRSSTRHRRLDTPAPDAAPNADRRQDRPRTIQERPRVGVYRVPRDPQSPNRTR